MNITHYFDKIGERFIMKTKIEYLDALENELKYLKPKARKSIINRYMDKINVELDFGIEESKIIEKMPSPNLVAQSIYKDYGIDLEQKKKQSFSTYAIITSIIASIVFIMLVSTAIFIYIYLIELLLNFFTLYKEVLGFDVLDAMISSINFTIFLLISLIVLVFVYELVLYLTIEITERLLIAYPNVDKSKFLFLDKCSILKHVSSLFPNVEKLVSKTIVVLIFFFVVVSVTSFFTNGYMYRVLMDQPRNTVEFVVDVEDRTSFSIEANMDEIKWIIKQSSSNSLQIEYKYEFDRNFTYRFDQDKLILSLNPIKQYDPFDLLKEPIHVVTIYVPNQIQVNELELISKQSALNISSVDIESLDYQANRGVLWLESFRSENVTSTIRSGGITLKDMNIESLLISTDSASTIVDSLSFSTAVITNQFGKIDIENMNGTLLEFDNGGGKSTILESNINRVVYQSRNGTLLVQESTVDVLEADLKATTQLDIYKGVYESIDITAEKGSMDIESVTIMTTVSIVGTEYFVSIIESSMIDLNVETNTGAIGIRDATIHQSVSVTTNQADVSVVEVETPSLDLTLTRGIVRFSNLYADMVKVYMESGDFSYENEDLSRVIGILDIVTNQANRRINVGN